MEIFFFLTMVSNHTNLFGYFFILSNDSIHWQHYSHDADIGVRGTGTRKHEAFEQCALAMTAVITDVESVAPAHAITVHCQAVNDELLLNEWLNALVFEMATRHMLFSRFRVHIENTQLNATVWGASIDVQRHQPAVEIKGATLTDLKVTHAAEGIWTAQCVVDV